MKRISSKVLLIITACSVLTSILVGWAGFLFASSFIKQEVEEKIIYTAQSRANSFSQTLVQAESYVTSLRAAFLASFDYEQFKLDPEYTATYLGELDRIMAEFAQSDNGALGIYVTFNPALTKDISEVWYQDLSGQGNLVHITNDTPFKENNGLQYLDPQIFTPEEEGLAYLYQTIREKRPIWFEPYQEIGLDVTAISYVMPIIVQDEVVAVVGMDIDFADIQQAITTMQVYEEGYAFLINNSGSLIVAPKAVEFFDGATTKTLNELIAQKAHTEPTGIVSVPMEQEITAFCRLTNGWILVIQPSFSEIIRPVRLFAVLISLFTLIIAGTAIYIGYRFSHRLAKTMDQAVNQLRQLESGELFSEIPPELLAMDDELGHFLKAVDALRNIMIEMLESIEQRDSMPSNQLSQILQAADKISNHAINVATKLEPRQTQVNETGESSHFALQGQMSRQKDVIMIYQARLAQTGQMISYIAHQWRQPLNNLGLILAELQDAFAHGEISEAELQQRVDKSRQILSALSETINDFQNFTKPDREKNNIDVKECLEIALSFLEPELKLNRIVIDSSVQARLLTNGFRNELIQALTNIISNAKDAIISTGSPGVIRVTALENGEYIVLEIINTGDKIPKDILDKLFLPYFTTKDKNQGSGIGLYLAKLIIEEHHHGTIYYENLPEGVKCAVRLPVGSNLLEV